VYLTPLLGGILADRVLGQRKTVVVGGILMAIGHFVMASEQAFFLAALFSAMMLVRSTSISSESMRRSFRN
jgi:dipeptide/tripeptide permease